MMKLWWLLCCLAYIQITYGWVKQMENLNLFEGDMILTPKQKEKVQNGDYGFGSKKDPRELWPRAEVPYDMSYDLASNQKAVKGINEAIAMYHKYTCIRFRKRRGERAYIHFFKGGGCSSGVGYGGGRNSISLDDGCYWRTTVMHEIAHSLGFYHEQSRPDRDNYVEILTHNILNGAEGNFKKQPYSNVDSRGSPYDVRSMMHYSWNAFGKDGQMTIRVLNSRDQYEIGNREGFSHGDIEQINKVYGCTGNYPTLPPYTRPPPGCYDLGGGCADSRAEGRCTASSWQSYMRKSCRRTCGFCGNGGGGPQPTSGTGGGTNCRDQNTASDCRSNIRHCRSSDSSWKDYMARVCKKTCGLC